MNLYTANREFQNFCKENKVTKLEKKMNFHGQDKTEIIDLSSIPISTVFEGVNSEIEHKDLQLFIAPDEQFSSKIQIDYIPGILQLQKENLTGGKTIKQFFAII